MRRHPLVQSWPLRPRPKLAVYRYAWRAPWVRAVLGGMFLTNVLVIITFVIFGFGGW